jgi:predicted helicase
MRQQLMQAFTEIYVLDLHGSSKKKEAAPDGSKDENVFDIQQGVCIGIFVKEPGKTGPARVYHADIYGDRQSKYKFLLSEDIVSVNWTKLTPSSPAYRFVPQDERRRAEYETSWATSRLFRVVHTGIITKRDELTIHWTADDAWTTASEFAVMPPDEARRKYALPADVRDWKVEWAQRDLQETGLVRERVIPILYRPFDVRYTYYTGNARGFIGWPVADVTPQMTARYNRGLVTARSNKSQSPDHFLATKHMTETKAGESTTQSCIMPLYLYPAPSRSGQQSKLDGTDASPWPAGKDGRRPNLSPEFVAEMEAKLELRFAPEQPEAGSPELFGPEDIFSYIYAICYSPTYRTRYAEFLKIDFPRVPLTSDKKQFWKLAALGRELVALHLLESPKVNDFVTKYPKKGSDTVAQVRYVEPDSEAVNRKPSAVSGRVFINDEQYFEGVKPEWFEFHIGGYQVLQKWLKDRKGRKLSNDDITHYQRVVVAIKETIRLMSEIDKAIPNWPIE